MTKTCGNCKFWESFNVTSCAGRCKFPINRLPLPFQSMAAPIAGNRVNCPTWKALGAAPSLAIDAPVGLDERERATVIAALYLYRDADLDHEEAVNRIATLEWTKEALVRSEIDELICAFREEKGKPE